MPPALNEIPSVMPDANPTLFARKFCPRTTNGEYVMLNARLIGISIA